MMKKLLILIFSFCFIVAKAQYQKPNFNTLSVRSGLPEAVVVTSIEDKNGYIWMGTQNGLVRYDGYRLKPYSFSADDGLPIANPAMSNLQQESGGKIWAYLRTGEIFYYNAPSDKFLKVPVGLEKKNSTDFHDVLSNIISDEDNISWLLVLNNTEGKTHL